MTVRTRVAPSPTGDPHLGTAYIALMNLLFARANGGEFILRVEDTDRERSTPASEAAILAALKWLGLAWSEGPDVGGPHGPYRQSERGAIYKKHADRLLASGHAHRCFCTKERLDALRAEQSAAKRPTGYDGRCASLSKEESDRMAAEGIPFVVRLAVPKTGSCKVEDLLQPREYPWSSVDAQILLKSDGMPTYHLASVVDDHLMGITHVIRGEEWLASTPKHLLLYKAFGWEPPVFAHLPLLRNADRSKLSKRKNPTGILWFKAMGYLPEAVLNYLGLFAVSMDDGEELMDLPKIQDGFSLSNIALGGPVFDLAKLDWLNGRRIREKMDDGQLLSAVLEWAFDPKRTAAILGLAKTRMEKLSDLGPLLGFLFSGRIPVSKDVLLGGKLDALAVEAVLVRAIEAIEDLREWTADSIGNAMKAQAEDQGVKLRDFVRPLYVAMSGSPTSLPVFDSFALLGRDLVRQRLRDALAALKAA